MLRTRRGEPAAADGSAGSLRRALAALCVTEIVSYGVIYYAFPVLAVQITAGTGWSRTAVTAAYSAGNLAGAAAGIPAGRLLQRHGPRAVMTAGSVLGAASVAGIAAAPSYWWFLAVWLAAGTASAGAVLPARLRGAYRLVRAAPGPGGHLADPGRRVRQHGLRPADLRAGRARRLARGLPGPRRRARRGHHPGPRARAAPAMAPAVSPPAVPAPGEKAAAARAADRQVLASRAFLQLVTAATLCAFAPYAALVNLVPLLTGRGLSPGLAAWALGLGGAGQVAGRLCYRALDARTGARGRAAAVIAAGSAVTLPLGLLPGPAALLVTAAVIAGAVRGLFTLTEATLVADQWGAGRYAVINGVFNAPLTAAGAIAPTVGAGIAAVTGSCPAMFAILAAVAAAGAALAGTAPAPSRPG